MSDWTPMTWAEFRDTTDPELDWIVKDTLHPGITFIAGPPKRGKSWLADHLAVACATGRPFLGQPVPRPVPVLLVALEGQRPDHRSRLGCLLRGAGVDPDGDVEHLHVRYRPRAADLMDAESATGLVAEVERLGIRVVIIDVLRAAAPRLRETGEGATDFGKIITNLAPLLDAGVLLVFVHHFVKGGAADRAAGERMTGSGALFGRLDIGLFVTAGNEVWKREIPYVLDVRGFVPQEQATAVIEGEGSGTRGRLLYRDAARIVVRSGSRFAHRILDLLVEYQGEHAPWMTANAIHEQLGGRKQDVLSELHALRVAGRVIQTEGLAVGMRSNAKPYAHADRFPPPSEPMEPMPGRVVVEGRFPPLGEGTDQPTTMNGSHAAANSTGAEPIPTGAWRDPVDADPAADPDPDDVDGAA